MTGKKWKDAYLLFGFYCSAPSCPEIHDIPEIITLSWNFPEIRNFLEILVIWYECPDIDCCYAVVTIFFILYLITSYLDSVVISTFGLLTDLLWFRLSRFIL